MDSESLQAGRQRHTAVEVIVAAHTAFNARNFDELDGLVSDGVDVFLPLSLGLTENAETGRAAFRSTLARVLALAPDLRIELERAEVVGDLIIVVCTAGATGTDGHRYTWPLRVIVAAEHGLVTRYVVRAPHADILADRAAFTRR